MRTAMRMLDNVIDINFYPVPDAERSNKKHRPVGLGVMGFQDVLWLMGGIPYASAEAIDIADMLQEHVSYYAIEASSDLAVERGKYRTYEGSLWSKGKLPIDTINDMQSSRETLLTMDLTQRLDWSTLRQKVLDQGMRNSNTMAIAPTATISNIQGVTQSIEPQFTNLFVKQNLSGTFTVVNSYLVADLKLHGLWDRDMLEEIKYWDGSIENIERIPVDIRLKYATAFEVEPEFLIEAASRRQKWIDMGQSLNLYIDQPSGKRLNDMYMLAWQYGLKTTYYLRAKGATSAEKSSIDVNKFGIRSRWSKTTSASSDITIDRITKPKPDYVATKDEPITLIPLDHPSVKGWVADDFTFIGDEKKVTLVKSLDVYDDPYEWSEDDICEACT